MVRATLHTWDTWQTRQTAKLRQPYARHIFESMLGNMVGNTVRECHPALATSSRISLVPCA